MSFSLSILRAHILLLLHTIPSHTWSCLKTYTSRISTRHDPDTSDTSDTTRHDPETTQTRPDTTQTRPDTTQTRATRPRHEQHERHYPDTTRFFPDFFVGVFSEYFYFYSYALIQ